MRKSPEVDNEKCRPRTEELQLLHDCGGCCPNSPCIFFKNLQLDRLSVNSLRSEVYAMPLYGIITDAILAYFDSAGRMTQAIAIEWWGTCVSRY